MSEIKTEHNQPVKPAVLITGGTGLIGRYLTTMLLEKGYNVSLLSRKENLSGKPGVYKWNPEKKEIDNNALKGVGYIVHLAGANIGEKRWTKKRKKEIIDSRWQSARFIHEVVTELDIPVEAFISASATGIYGSLTSEKIFRETDPPAQDFLGNVCRCWEEAADSFNSSGIRTVIIRTGVVLEKNDSALTKIMKPREFGFLVQTGSGIQYMPWIHIKDLCNIYLKAIEDPLMRGTYNAVAPDHVMHREFMHVLARVMKTPLFPFAIPGSVLRAVLGNMSDLILKGSRVSSEKLVNSGYRFLFGDLENALENIIRE
jgi:uncharacterized protein